MVNSDLPIEQPKQSRVRRQFLLALLLVFPLILKIPWVSNSIKDIVVMTINEVGPFVVHVHNCRIRPFLLGVNLEGVRLEEDSKTLAEVDEIFIGFKIPWDGLFVRSLVVDHPKIQLDLTTLPKSEADPLQEYIVPLLPRIQIRSASVDIINGQNSIQIPDVSFTHNNGRAHFWTDETILVKSKAQTVLISPFQWNNILVDDGNLYIKDINLQSSLGTVYGTVGLEDSLLNGEIHGVLDLTSGIQHPKWEGQGYIQYELEPRGKPNDISFLVGVSADPFSLTRQAIDRTFTYQFDDLSGNVLFSEGTFFLQEIMVGWADGQSIVNGEIQNVNNQLSLTIQGVEQDLWGVGQDLDLSPAPWLEMKTSSVVNLSGTLRPLYLEGMIDLQGESFRTASGNIRDKIPNLEIPKLDLQGELQVSKTELHYQLSEVVLTSSQGIQSQGFINGSFGFKAPNETQIEYDFPTFDLTLLRPLGNAEMFGSGRAQGILRGPMKQLQLDSTYQIKDFSMMGISYADHTEIRITAENLKHLHIDVLSAQKGVSTLVGDMELKFGSELWMDGEFTAQNARANNLMAMFFDPLSVDANASGFVRIQGVSSDLSIVSEMTLNDILLWGEPFDTGHFSLSQTKEGLTIETFSVERNDGLGSALMRGTRHNGENNFEVLVGGLPVEYLSWIIDSKIPVRGKIDFLGRIRGDSFLPNGTLHIRDFWHGSSPLGDTNLQLHVQNEGLVIRGQVANGFSIEGVSGFDLDEDFIFDVTITEFPLASLYTLDLADDRVSGVVSMNGQIWQRNQELGGDLLVEALSLSWGDRWLKMAESTQVNWDGVTGNFTPLQIIGSGQTDLQLSGVRQGHRHNLTFDGLMDMSVIEMVLDGTQRASGLGTVSGVWTEQGMDATLDIQNGFLQGSWFPHPLESINANITMFDQKASIDNWESIVGGGQVTLNGDIELKNFIPDRYDLSLEMTQSRIQLLDWLPPVLGTGSFRVTGDAVLPMITGRVEAEEMSFVERIGWEGALITFAPEAIAGASEEEAEPYFEYDIDFAANNTIRIRNNLADMRASADLKFIGDMAHPGMIGSIVLEEGGRVLFKERDFDVLRGVMRYDDPLSFDPMLDIALETAVLTPEREIDIKYYITGVYSDWKTHTTSNPSLPQADINALLLFGMTRRELETEGGLGAALAIEGSDLMVSKFGTSQRFVEVGNGIFQSELLRLDRVDIVSGPTDRNSAYVSSALRLLAEKDIGDGTLRLEQNITDTTDVFASWEQRLSERLYMRLYWASQQQGRSINNNGAVGAEFEVQWELD